MKLLDVTQAPAGIRHEVVNVTPKLARQWLTRSIRNRPISKLAVARYRGDMQSGIWKFAADPIRFDDEGNLIDGQHRASAIAGLPENFAIPMLVIRGLDSESQMVMDQGRKRQAGQQLAMLGYKNSAALAAGARLLIVWNSGALFDDGVKGTNVTAPMIQEWVIHHPQLVNLVNTYPAFVRTLGARPSATLAFLFKVASTKKSLAIEFFNLLHDRSELPKGSPILALDNKFRNFDGHQDSFRFQRDQLGYYITAWNAWVDGRPLTKLQRPKGDWTSRNFPEPK